MPAIPKKFLFVSYAGNVTDLARQVAREGHDVRFAIEAEGYEDVGRGFMDVVADWRKNVAWADIVIFDHIGKGADAQKLRAEGKLVIGGTPYTDRLEDDRTFGQNELSRHGVHIIPYREFTSFEAGIEYVRSHPGRYVIKPCGDAQYLKRLLFVGGEADGNDVVRILTSYSKVWSDIIGTFQLQKRVTGVEVGLGAFFNGRKFLEPVYVNFEHKKLFPGELGVPTCEMGTSAYWTPHSHLFEATLRRFEPTLAAEGYVGYIDINCIVNGRGIYPLEFTCRFGFPLTCLQEEGIIEPMGTLLLRMAGGDGTDISVKRGYQVCAVIAVPPFPFDDPQAFRMYSRNAVVMCDYAGAGVHIGDLRCENDQWLITGEEGIAAVISGSGMTMREAQRQMYARIERVVINHMYYRTDIGDRWAEDSDLLRAWGYTEG